MNINQIFRSVTRRQFVLLYWIKSLRFFSSVLTSQIMKNLKNTKGMNMTEILELIFEESH